MDNLSNFEYDKLWKPAPGHDAKGVFSRMHDGSLEAVKESIDDIEKMIEERKELHMKVISDLENAEIQVGNFINQLSPTDEKTKEHMFLFKTKSIEIAQAKRDEKITCWHDIAKLKEELRVHKKELNEKKKRLDMLDSILSK